MAKGIIRRLTTDRGFGFIKRAEGEDLFFHRSELHGVDFGCLREGQEVEFEVKQRFSGHPQAIKVRLAQPQGEQHKAWAGRFGGGVMFYFAYGSNLSHKQMFQRCPDRQLGFKATLPNYKLIFAGWSREWHGGVASIKPFAGNKVTGAVYEISEKDLRSLDKYEGYPTVYDRLNIMVITEDSDLVKAITYIMQEQSEEKQPSQEYLAVIRQGYKDWDIRLCRSVDIVL